MQLVSEPPSNSMVRTNKIDHIFISAPCRSPLTDRINLIWYGWKDLDFSYLEKLSVCWYRFAHLNNTKRLHWLAVGLQQRSQPSFQSTVLGQFSLPKCVYEKKMSCTCRGPRISQAYFSGFNGRQYTHRCCMHGRNPRVIVKVTTSSALEKNTRMQLKSTSRHAGRFQWLGLLRTFIK